MEIVIFEAEQWEQQSFQELAAEHNLSFTREPLNPETASRYATAEIISTFIYSELSVDTLKCMEGLRFIATRSTGFDHIDLNWCRNHKIAVANVPTYGERTVAEHVFALLLAISHHLVEATDRTRKGDFTLQGLQGFDLQGKTLGIIGTGNIGLCVIRIAGGFGMEIIAYDVKRDHAASERLGFEYVDFDTLLRRADIISLHVPANKHTRNMLAQEQFDRMKQGVVIVNTARGEVINVVDLVAALGSGRVAAAGLDVLPDEPTIREEAELLRSFFREKHDLETLLADQILLRLRNVIITPHCAFNTREAVQRIIDTSVDNIRSFLEGRPQNVVSEKNRMKQ